MTEYERIERDGLVGVVAYDEEPESPREWVNLGTMVCWHGRYDLGDRFPRGTDYKGIDKVDPTHYDNEGDLLRACGLDPERDIILPLYLLDHSGLAMRTSRFHEDPGGWDSGRVGFIAVTLGAVRNVYGVQRVSAKLREKVTRQLEGEVGLYSSYLEGECYGWYIETAEGEHLDSCTGYIGDIEYVRGDLTKAMDYLAKDRGYRQETYRGFIIESEHQGEDGEVTGYAVTVDEEAVGETVGEEVGSAMGGFATVEDAKTFIDAELGRAK